MGELPAVTPTFLQLTKRERRAVCLAIVYEKLRDDAGLPWWWVQAFGSAYRDANPFLCHDPEVLRANKYFKTFLTLADWLTNKGVDVSMEHLDWQGYMEFAFEFFSPTAPCPFQLKNNLLFRQYCQTPPDIRVPPSRTTQEMNAIYERQLRQAWGDEAYAAMFGSESAST